MEREGGSAAWWAVAWSRNLRGAVVRTLLLLIAVAVVAGSAGVVQAQITHDEDDTGGIRLGTTVTQRYRVGVYVKAVGGACRGIKATLPVPLDWPEQTVRMGEEDISAEVKSVRYRTIGDSVKQMLIEIPLIRAGEEAHALVTFEVERRMILMPQDTSRYEIPSKVDRDLKRFLGPSPQIETSNRKIRTLAKKVVADHEGGWDKAEAIYDHVLANVAYEFGPLKGALRALNDGTGDCEDLSSLFIAMCRVSGIPARTVWVPDHCYPEFYLVDGEGKGYWFPCQAAGTRAFGEMPEQRPILQKGDNFRVPEKKRPQRYVAEFLSGTTIQGGGKPKVRWVRELLD